MPIRIYNTLTRRKEDFEPAEKNHVRMYVCGITAYAPSHIGHARSAVCFDVLARWVRRSYRLTYVRNFTDVDDKIIRAAAAEGEDPSRLAARYVDQFREDMQRLGCRAPDIEPRVTEHIPDIIRFIERIAEVGLAYVVDGDVFFEVAKDPRYGALSGRTEEDLEAGARVEVDERKRSPRDFALWKSAKPGEPSWPSPWGPGRPGWHIECSAMAAKYLGTTFDIHGGGKDLVFPHHENEIAQSCAAHEERELARFWVHNGFVNLMPEGCPSCGAAIPKDRDIEPGHRCETCGHTYSDDDFKMSKSRGNFYPVGEIMDRFEPEALRLLFLNTHYRKPIQFSVSLLQDAERRLDRNYETLAAIDRELEEAGTTPGAIDRELEKAGSTPGAVDERSREEPSRCHSPSADPSIASIPDGRSTAARATWVELLGADPTAEFREAMDDDLNTAKAVAEIAEVFRFANEVVRRSEKERLGRSLSAEARTGLLAEVRALVTDAGDALGLWQEQPKAFVERRRLVRASGRGIEPLEVEAAIRERQEARRNRDFKRADRLRSELAARGILLKDNKDGSTEWDVEDT